MRVKESQARSWPAGLTTLVCAVSLAAAAVYGLLPFTYTYFSGEPYFGYADNPLGRAIGKSTAAAYYERAWGVRRQVPFRGGDITCQLRPAAAAPGCARPLQTNEMVFGPYVLLPEGRYRAVFEVSAAPGCRNPLRVDVYAGDFSSKPLTYADLTADKARAQLEFDVGVAMAGREAVEFRTVQLSGASCAVLKRVSLARLRS